MISLGSCTMKLNAGRERCCPLSLCRNSWPTCTRSFPDDQAEGYRELDTTNLSRETSKVITGFAGVTPATEFRCCRRVCRADA